MACKLDKFCENPNCQLTHSEEPWYACENYHDCENREGCEFRHQFNNPCYKFMQKECMNGDECRFSHKAEDIKYWEDKIAFYKTIPCPNKNKCDHNNCKFNHDVKPVNYRTIPCQYFNSPSGCRYGDKCNYIHAKPEFKSVNREDGRCRYFNEPAKCKYGDRCKFEHSSGSESKNAALLTRVNRSPVIRSEVAIPAAKQSVETSVHVPKTITVSGDLQAIAEMFAKLAIKDS